MDQKEKESKEKFLGNLILISSIIVAIKSIGEIDPWMYIWFLVFSVLYYAIISNKLLLNNKRLLVFAAFIVSIFFSALIGVAIGRITPLEPFKSVTTVVYYLTLTLVLTVSLNDTKYNQSIFTKIKDKVAKIKDSFCCALTADFCLMYDIC